MSNQLQTISFCLFVASLAFKYVDSWYSATMKWGPSIRTGGISSPSVSRQRLPLKLGQLATFPVLEKIWPPWWEWAEIGTAQQAALCKLVWSQASVVHAPCSLH